MSGVRDMRLGLLSLLLAGLTACAPAPWLEWNKPGIPVEQWRVDANRCNNPLLPPSSKKIEEPAGALMSGGWASYTSDQLYRQEFGACMREKGYRQVALTPEQASALPDLPLSGRRAFIDRFAIAIDPAKVLP